ncbi:hypothetical protein RRG08_023497 [Elysia crispata]|uniref:Uncharacterized protein n=1 Tax=Elysia crispata TaxID=231223 RepID=A0AAE0YY23_9GAST|nr:hypothetical protein RRG08_023497 [Elysia crispata]
MPSPLSRIEWERLLTSCQERRSQYCTKRLEPNPAGYITLHPIQVTGVQTNHSKVVQEFFGKGNIAILTSALKLPRLGLKVVYRKKTLSIAMKPRGYK